MPHAARRSYTKEMLSCARTYHEVNGSCCYCAMARALKAPSEDSKRPSGEELIVYQNELFVAFCPWAPVGALHLMAFACLDPYNTLSCS